MLGIDREHAFLYLLECLPRYEEFLTFPDEGATLLHLAMGDLGRYYMAHARLDPELANAYWSAVERLASEGDSDVTNAVHVSLIEWFAGGDPSEKSALTEAAAMQGPATKAMIDHFRQDL